MAYTKTIWINDVSPAINAVRLNNMETGIHTAVLHADSAHAAAGAEANDPNTTLQGNTFNGVYQLVKTDASTGKMPALDGSQITDIQVLTENVTYDKTVEFTEVLNLGSVPGARTIDLGASQYQAIGINAPVVVTFIPPSGPSTVYLHIYNNIDAGTITLPEGKWPNGIIPGLEPNGHDLLMIHYDGTQYIYGMMQNLRTV